MGEVITFPEPKERSMSPSLGQPLSDNVINLSGKIGRREVPEGFGPRIIHDIDQCRGKILEQLRERDADLNHAAFARALEKLEMFEESARGWAYSAGDNEMEKLRGLRTEFLEAQEAMKKELGF